MKPTSQAKAPLDLIEESTHLLRSAPAPLLALYYAGSVPFVLGLLYFWADMSRNPFANQHIADAALAMTALFVWMKFCQSLFARRVRARAAGEPLPPLRVAEAFRILVTQTVLQSLGLVPIGLCLVTMSRVPPLGLLLAIVIGFLLPFFWNITALADSGGAGMTAVFKKAWRFWWIWRGQSLAVLAVLYFFGVYVFFSWTILSVTLPNILKMLFGIDSVFTRSPLSMLNSTFLMAMYALTYLSVDPIFKTLCTLRCFYGESVKSGEDLKAELKRLSTQSIPIVLAALMILVGSITARAANDSSTAASPQLESQNAAPVTASPATKPQGISSPDLDHAIDQTIHERKYTWRMPREKTTDNTAPRDNAITRFFNKIAEFLRKCLRAIGNWFRAIAEWLDRVLRKLFFRRNTSYSPHYGSGEGWITFSQLLLFLLIVVVACALGIFIYRLWLNRRPKALVTSQPLQSVPDISDENVGADQLPEDGWTKLARELLERGEFRLAMRAFYLASLAHLAQRNLISLARFKSNRDYERELHRRGHSFPDLLTVFGDNLSIFERIWYGLHEVDGESVGRFATNVERMKGFG